MTKLSEVSQKISQFVSEGNIGKDVVLALMSGDEVIKSESVLWDFKQDYPSDAVSWGKIIRSIAAFYNAFGGYLIFGVQEDDVGGFRFHASGDVQVKQEHLRDNVDKYIDQKPNCSVAAIEVNGNKAVIIHIPKREIEKPAFFIRNGPNDTSGKCIFNKNQAYLRQKDQSRPAQEPEDWHFLYSERNLVKPTSNIFESKRQIEFVNAPNRSLICPKFVGRKRILTNLWEWVGDEFESAKVIAGEGGKGKTSIAFEFATQFSANPLNHFEQIVWLSAKKKQFSGLKNNWIEMPQVQYVGYESLLKAFTNAMPIPGDLDLSNIALLKRELRNCFRDTPTLMIIDDVDSLETNDQKRVLELAHQIAAKSKFLFTTRINTSFSTDMTLTIPGFPLEEYTEYLKTLSARFGLDVLEKFHNQLFAATDGSPLLTESIVRLVRLGEQVNKAIADWKGKSGEEARSAVLEREIQNLAPESKRVLLALAYFREASQAELLLAVGFRKATLLNCIEELDSLFLVDVRQITAAEPRIGISSNAQNLVIEIREKLVADFNKLFHSVKNIVEGSKIRVGNTTLIGSTINQAMALIIQNDHEAAIASVESTLKTQKTHPDLLLMLARCYLSRGKGEDLKQARLVLLTAYTKGQRRPLFFEKWYEAEERADYSIGMKDVSEKALDSQIGDKGTWEYRLADAYYRSARNRMSSLDVESALAELDEASKHLVSAIRGHSNLDKEVLFRTSRALHDYTIDVLDSKRATEAEFIDWLIRIVERGDRRTKFYLKLVDMLENLKRRANLGSSGLRRLFNKKLVDCSPIFANAIAAEHGGVLNLGIQERFGRLTLVDELPVKHGSVNNSV